MINFVIAEVKSAPSDDPNGEFEIVMSTDSIDRDGESIVKGAFEPLPASVPVHAFHDFNDPVGRAVPSYNEAGQLVGKGHFASTPRAQEIRQLVADGVIGHTSVGFMAAERKSADDGPPLVLKAELLEVSFVSVPSNRDAAVLMVKQYDRDLKVGARNSQKDATNVQGIHDLAVAVGAICEHSTNDAPAASPEPDAGTRSVPAPDSGEPPVSKRVVEKARLMAQFAIES